MTRSHGLLRHPYLQLTVVLVIAAGLRFYHLDWGTDPGDGRFHALHPDEGILVHAAGKLAENFKPSLSGYGALSLYLPWILWPIAWVSSVELFDPADPRGTFILLRALSATAGLMAVLLTWRLGCRLADRRAGLLSAGLLAVSTLSIQQSHYYTVDGLFTAVALATVLLCLRALDRHRPVDWLIIGVAVGLAAGLRINGLLLMAPAAAAALLGPATPGSGLRRAFIRCVWAGIAALATLLLLQPYMVLDPAHYFSQGTIGSLFNSAAIATGDIPRIWTLYDSAQIPYWFHLTNLLAHAVGPGLQLVGLAGLVWMAWRRRRQDLVCLVFVVVFILAVGRLEAKNIRYLTPVVPFLCVGAGMLLAHGFDHVRRNLRRVAMATAALCMLSSTLYAVAYVQVYGETDPRLVSLDVVRSQFSPGARIGYEHTGVHVAQLAREHDDFSWEPDPFGFMFNLDQFLLSSEKVALACRWLQDVDGVVIVDVARMRHFTAAADSYPIEAEFYRRLFAGEAGYRIVADVDRGPVLGGLSLTFRNTDPSFDGFDHPRVTVLRRTSDRLQQYASQWAAQVQRDPACIDAHLLDASRAMAAGDLAAAFDHANAAAEISPGHRLPMLFRCELLLRQDRVEESNELWNRLVDELGPQAGSYWQHEATGFEYAGTTLNKLGATTVGQRCLEASVQLR